MVNIDRLTKLLLGLLVAGVWGILINQVLQTWTQTVEAQTKKTAAPASRQYGTAAIDKAGNLIFDGDGSIVLSATGLQAALKTAPVQGWKINSVVFSNYETFKGWTVIVEK